MGALTVSLIVAYMVTALFVFGTRRSDERNPAFGLK